MLNTMMPLEVEISVQLNKLLYAGFVSVDAQMAVPDYLIKDMKTCKVRNMNMIEELGDISYLFCDKTGTLTQNELEFKAFSIVSDNNQALRIEGTPASRKEQIKENQKNPNMVNFFKCINLCHESTTIESKLRKGHTEFCCTSVDEVCFLDMAREVKDMGYFLERDSQNITLQTLVSTEKYRVLKYFPFTSDRKASSIVVRD